MVKIDHLWFSYTGMPPYILSDINIDVAEGEYISFIGENGCGKTTLMRLLLGSLKPSRGSILVDTRYIGYVPQRNNFTNANFPITVYELLYSYLRLLKLKDKAIIEEALRFTGMDMYKNTLMGNLSGGQTQKILISRALMGTPKLLILDEPSTGIDIDSQKDIYGLLKKLSLEQKITILSVEHNLQAAFANSTKIFHIQHGTGHLCSPEHYKMEYLTPDRKDE